MADRNHPKPPRNHLCNHQKDMQISAVTTVTTSFLLKGGVETKKSGNRPQKAIKGPYGESVETAVAVVTAVTPLPASLGEPDARGVPRLVGEDHPRAILTNDQVELIRSEYEAGIDGTGPKIGYRALAKKYNTSKRTIRDIVAMRRRNTWPDRWAVPRRRRNRRRVEG